MSISYKRNRAQSAGELTPFMYKWPLREKKKDKKRKKKSQSVEKTIIPGPVEMEPYVIVKMHRSILRFSFVLFNIISFGEAARFCDCFSVSYVVYWRGNASIKAKKIETFYIVWITSVDTISFPRSLPFPSPGAGKRKTRQKSWKKRLKATRFSLKLALVHCVLNHSCSPENPNESTWFGISLTQVQKCKSWWLKV